MTKKKLFDPHGRATVPLASRQMTPYEPVTFSGTTTTRVCNASIREIYAGHELRDCERGARNKAIPSIGQGC